MELGVSGGSAVRDSLSDDRSDWRKGGFALNQS